MQSTAAHYPPELLFSICAAVYHAGLPPADPAAHSSLDPVLPPCTSAPHALPSTYPADHWPEYLSRRTLAFLCLVSRDFYAAAKPWLWRKLEVRFPQGWLALVAEIGNVTDNDSDTDAGVTALAPFSAAAAADDAVGLTLERAASAALAAVSPTLGAGGGGFGGAGDEARRKLQEAILASLAATPGSSIPPELLSPPASREPSPRRLPLRAKSKSPARWKVIRSISDAVQNVFEMGGAGFYVPTPDDPSPGRHVMHLDFNHFRTIGMRRSVGDGVTHRFVTGERLEVLLKECPNLTIFGATEYMDSALTLNVLKELLLRGSPSRGRGRPSRGRNSSPGHDDEEMDRERRRECKDLIALDLTGCVSAVFYNALTEFVRTHISPEDASDDRETHHRGRDVREPLSFHGLQRLGLRGVTSIPAEILNPFVLALPSLTHLDLSGTRITPDLLSALAASPSVRLKSLGLARCTRLPGSAIASFLVDASAARELTELTLYGDPTFPSRLTSEDVATIVSKAPAFTSGRLEYLDLSSAPVSAANLRALAPQPRLRSLGLSYIPALTLPAIAEFLRTRAPAVEVLSIISTAPELEIATGVSAKQASMALHTHLIRPLCQAPLRVSLSDAYYGERAGFGYGFGFGFGGHSNDAPTRLRVLELSIALLSRLGGGAGAWRIVRSKGGRGWYVDTASGWVDGVLCRGLPREHPLRMELERLADANGNVSSGVGWHARKLEILYGHGLLGREDGLYGAVSFAYQG